MLGSIVRTALKQRIVVVVLAFIALGFGIDATRKLSVDAFPDVTNVQVQVATEVPGRSPDEVERIVTVPVEIGMTGLPGMTEMRSQNEPGLSIITLVFTDETPVYFARQLVSERLGDVRSRLPAGFMPVLGPVSTALSEVYQYTLENPERRRARAHQGRTRRAPHRAGLGGAAAAALHPGRRRDQLHRRLRQAVSGAGRSRSSCATTRSPSATSIEALARNNANSSGGILPRGPEFYLVRGVGLIRDLDDIRSIVLKEVGATPVYIRDVAEVKFGEEVRYGAMIKGGYTEAVGGIVMMIASGNAKEIVARIKERVEEINSKGMLPDGLQDRAVLRPSELVDAAA